MKGIFISLKKGLVDMHAAPILAKNGLRHKTGVCVMLPGDLLDHYPVGHGLVRHAETLIVSEIDLMLTGRHLMMTVFHLDAHGLKGENGRPPEIAPHIQRS